MNGLHWLARACRKGIYLLESQRDDVLTPAEDEWLRRHLSRCTSCKQRNDAALAAADLLVTVRVPRDARKHADWESILGLIHSDTQPAGPVRAARFVWIVASGAVAAMLLIMAVQHMGREDHRQPSVLAARVVPDLGPRHSPKSQDRRAVAERPEVNQNDRRNTQAAPALVTTGVAAGQTQPAASADRRDDMAYVNTDSVAAIASWPNLTYDRLDALRARIDRMVRGGDDFVQVQFPQFAGVGNSAVRAAAAAYQKEKEIVDPRLSRSVTLGVKSMAFTDLCDLLARQTQVDLRAARRVANDNVTVFCEGTPLRDIMRQITHVFGFQWIRTGDEPRYAYELTQDLRSQLAEERLCEDDTNASFLDIDRKMAAAKWGDQSLQATAAGLFRQLGPGDLSALRNGGKVTFSGWSVDPSHRLSPELSQSTVQNFGKIEGPQGVFNDRPGVQGSVTLQCDRSELGEVSLQADIQITQVSPDGRLGAGYGWTTTLATGQPPAAANPDNATFNQAVRQNPALQRRVSLHPKPSCPIFSAKGAPAEQDLHYDRPIDSTFWMERAQRGIVNHSHVTSADIWEEVHAQTHLPVVADSFLHIYPTEEVTVSNRTIFDALNTVVDKMGAHWKLDGEFVEGRSVDFFWDRRKEVPNQLLARWREDSRRQGGLPLDDLIEMASLADEQLDSAVVGDSITHCWQLPEWDLLKRPIGYYSPRPFLRLMATMSADERKKLLAPEGISFKDLAPARQQMLFGLISKERPDILEHPDAFTESRFRLDYVPSTYFVWRPVTRGDTQLATNRWPVVSARTVDAALEAARKFDPGATREQILRSEGIVSVTQFNAKGEGFLIQGIRPARYTP